VKFEAVIVVLKIPGFWDVPLCHRAFRTFATTHPVTQHHIAEDWNLY